MRVIEVDKDDSWRSISNIASVMLFPEDDRLRRDYATSVEWHFRLNEARDNQKFALSKQDIEALLIAPSTCELEGATGKQGAIGQIAGELLTLALQIEVAGQGPSLRKARFLIGKRNEYANESRKVKLWASDASLKKAWSQYCSVAHLWGALAILAPNDKYGYGAYSKSLGVTDIPDILASISLSEFASTATRILDLAANVAPRHQINAGQALLEKNSTWSFSSGLVSPPDINLLSPLPDWARSLLETYRRSPATD